jgi:hypothetical protein
MKIVVKTIEGRTISHFKVDDTIDTIDRTRTKLKQNDDRWNLKDDSGENYRWNLKKDSIEDDRWNLKDDSIEDDRWNLKDDSAEDDRWNLKDDSTEEDRWNLKDNSIENDHWNLKDDIIEDESTRPLASIHIAIATLIGRRIVVDVFPWDTINSIMCKIRVQLSIPLNQQRLFFDGKVLNGDCTVSDYNVHNGATFQLVGRTRSRKKKIFVSYNNEKTITLKVDLSDTIRKVKNQIKSREGISIVEQRLFVAGKELDDCRMLSDYNVQYESIIHLVLPRRCLLMP